MFLCIITIWNESSFLSGGRTIRIFWECGQNQHQMQCIRVVFRKTGTPVDTSCVVAIVFPSFLRQQTSHIQQASPTSGDLNSFVLPIHKWVQLLLQYEVMPQGVILTRLTGSKFLIQFAYSIRHLYRWTFAWTESYWLSSGFCLFWTENIRTESCTAVIRPMWQKHIKDADQLTAHGNHCLRSL